MTIIVPFAGSPGERAAISDRLARMTLAPADEVLIVDNSRVASEAALPPRIRSVRAGGEGSSYHARNTGALATAAEWLLFMDADCRPLPDLLDLYFSEPIADDCGAIAGGIMASPARTVVGRYAKARQHLDPVAAFNWRPRPYGATANLLVRRAAWEAVGGFCEGIRSAGDQEFCWRLQESGWKFELRLRAQVEHDHRESVRSLTRQFLRYGAGTAWLRRRHGHAVRRQPLLRMLAKGAVVAVQGAAARDRDKAAFGALDAAVGVALATGYVMHNRPPWRNGTAPSAEASVKVGWAFPCEPPPEPGKVIEAVGRASRPLPWTIDRRAVRYWEDDSYGERLQALARLTHRDPSSVVRRLRATRRAPRGLERLAVVTPLARLLKNPTEVSPASATDRDLADYVEAIIRDEADRR